MVQGYPVKYRDEFGEEVASIQNDGKILRMVLRGVEFIGSYFHGFKPQHATEIELNQFNLFWDTLCAYTLDCEIPVSIVGESKIYQKSLHIHVEHGKPVAGSQGTEIHRKDGTIINDDRHIEREALQLSISFHGTYIETSGKNRCYSFDEQLAELRDLLPENAYLRICWSCAHSAYHPCGSGAFGELGCFRDNKAEYHSVRSKSDLMAIWDKSAEFVQETHLCPEFE